MITFDDLLEKLKQEDETSIVEILDLRTDDIVNKFEDLIFDTQERLRDYYNEDDQTLDW